MKITHFSPERLPFRSSYKISFIFFFPELREFCYHPRLVLILSIMGIPTYNVALPDRRRVTVMMFVCFILLEPVEMM